MKYEGWYVRAQEERWMDSLPSERVKGILAQEGVTGVAISFDDGSTKHYRVAQEDNDA